MTQTTFYAIGMMSGTSLDGLDICYTKLWFTDNKWHFSILNSDTISYTKSWKFALETAQNLTQKDRFELDKNYSSFLGQTALTFIGEHKIKTIDFIASHGHTVFHQPKKKVTVQIGNQIALFDTTQITTVCDFRVQDVLLGGQGAPLVPIGDKLLFSDYAACLNLGGFANTSLEKENKRIAFDICPLNIVLNELSEKLGHNYDVDGKMAKNGKQISTLFAELNALDYYQKPLPKSLGREWVEMEIAPLFKAEYPTQDVLHTFVEHAAYQIYEALKNVKGQILVTGGGSFNIYFLDRLKAYGLVNIHLPETEIIHQKEALIFAFLGALRLQNEVNCLQTVTGANRDHSSGRIYQ